MEEVSSQNYWKKCSSCKKEIKLNTNYYVCSVSTCNGERTGYVFCSVPCFEVHLPSARHRDAGAVEKISPKSNSESEPVRKRIIISGPVNSSASGSSVTSQKSSMENEVLVVVSKMKQYIRDVSGMNTSEDVNQIISHMIRLQLDRAIENAKSDGRKTVMARDFNGQRL